MVELDFLYPSEGIHKRWDYGYRITATAATWDQAAFVLSVPRRKLQDETQETLRTSSFPSVHVKVGQYLSDVLVAVCFNYNWFVTYYGGFCRRSGQRTCILHLFAMEEQFLDLQASLVLLFF